MGTRTKNQIVLKKQKCGGFFYFNFFKRNVETKNVCPIAYNVWCYEQVCLAEMFNFSTNVIGKLAYSTCYVPFLFTNLI